MIPGAKKQAKTFSGILLNKPKESSSVISVKTPIMNQSTPCYACNKTPVQKKNVFYYKQVIILLVGSDSFHSYCHKCANEIPESEILKIVNLDEYNKNFYTYDFKCRSNDEGNQTSNRT